MNLNRKLYSTVALLQKPFLSESGNWKMETHHDDHMKTGNVSSFQFTANRVPAVAYPVIAKGDVEPSVRRG